MLQYSRSTCSYVNNEAGWDLVYLIYKTRRQPANKLRIIHDYKWTCRLGSLLNTSSKWNACHITKKRIWGNKWTQSSERLLAIRISIWLGAHRSPASLREGGDILFMISGSFLSLLLCSCIWLLKWMNKMRLWEETLQSEHSNLTFFLRWSTPLLPLCMHEAARRLFCYFQKRALDIPHHFCLSHPDFHFHFLSLSHLLSRCMSQPEFWNRVFPIFPK